LRNTTGLRKVLLIIFVLLLRNSYAQTLCTLTDTSGIISLNRNFAFYEDQSHSLTAETAFKSDQFKQIDGDFVNFNITSAQVWGRGLITTTAKRNWYLALDPSQFKLFSIFTRHKGQSWREFVSGNLLEPSQRNPRINHFIFPLDIDPGDTVEVMLSIREYIPMQINLHAAPLETYMEQFHLEDIYNCIGYGLMLMMMIYNLYLFIVQRRRMYLYYVLYILTSLTFSAHINGHVMYWPQWLKYFAMETVPVFIPISFGVFGLLFTLDLFGNSLPKSIRRISWAFIVLAVGEILLSASPAKYAAEITLQVMGILLCILSIACGVTALRKKHVSAKFYLLGFGAYMLSLMYIILASQNLLPHSTALISHALITGSAIESIMLSFAAGDKLKISEKEKEAAQAEALRQAKENEKLVREQNIELERKVQERTAELAEKNKEILDSIRYASRIQRSLLPQEKYIERILKSKN
jgi:hypothetical protein